MPVRRGYRIPLYGQDVITVAEGTQTMDTKPSPSNDSARDAFMELLARRLREQTAAASTSLRAQAAGLVGLGRI